LCSFKEKKYEITLSSVERALEDKNSSMPIEMEKNFLYLKALCLKTLKKYEDCEEFYRKLMSKIGVFEIE
jgi:hypothetical protein